MRTAPPCGARSEGRLLQRFRRWVTQRVRRAAVSAAPRLSRSAIERIGDVVARGGPLVPVLSRQIADNMRSAGVWSPAVLREHFRRLGEHFSGALHVQRCAGRTGGAAASAELDELIRQRFTLDESVDRLRRAAAEGRGAVLVCPHMTDYLLNIARLHRDVPITVYLRHGKDASHQEAKERWYRASGVAWVSEPAGAGGALGRMAPLAAALAEGRVVLITPDLPQKCDEGVGVRFCGRQICLPAGAALLALRSGAPLHLLTAAGEGGRQRLSVSAPYEGFSEGRGRAGRRAAVQDSMQWFACGFEQFVRTEPALWYLWGDKRWTRVFRGDPRYHCPARSEA